MLLDGSFTDVRDCLCGQCFDSGPVDFISRNGVKFLAPPTTSSRATRSAAAAAADALDAVLGARFARERSELWAVLRRAEALPQTAPTLFVYSADDELAPVEVIETFAAALRDAGRPVRMQRWDRSGAFLYSLRAPYVSGLYAARGKGHPFSRQPTGDTVRAVRYGETEVGREEVRRDEAFGGRLCCVTERSQIGNDQYERRQEKHTTGAYSLSGFLRAKPPGFDQR